MDNVGLSLPPKDSYRQAGVLAFLDRHLPKVDEQLSRRWRIIMADDYSAHLCPAVFRLCWSRRYVFIPHGGGVTPVAQTPDTDLNQWVKREYTDRVTCDPFRQTREGTGVPLLRQEECIGIMVDVLSNTALHVNVARRYLRTGMTVDLDGLQDQEIVREAGAFWAELGMRTKINSAVADAREEHNAKRLSWNMRDIQRLIRPYPINRKSMRPFGNLRTTLGALKANVHMQTRARGRATTPRSRGFRRGTQRGGGGGG